MEMVEDVVLLILLWLPVKSLLRFKAVCKSWRSIIESSAFISQHLHHHHHHLDVQDDSWNLIVLEPFQSGFSFLSGNNFQFSRNLEFRIQLGICPEIIATCDGIVCLKHGDYPDISLWNPATRQFITLPKAPQPLPYMASHHKFTYGFGFDHTTNDYKVVKILITDDNTPLGNVIKSQTYVYSLSTNSWRIVNVVVPVNLITFNPKFPFRNGIYCWVGAREYIVEDMANGEEGVIRNAIFYFDFSSEVFGTIPMPQVYDIIPPRDNYYRRKEVDKIVPDAYDNDYCGLVLGFLRENIACIESHRDSADRHFQIWVLNQFGANDSWSKAYTVPIEERGYLFGMSKNEKIFWVKTYYSGRTVLYLSDPVMEERNILPVKLSSNNVQVAVYKESLISIKGLLGATATKSAICADLSKKCQPSS